MLKNTRTRFIFYAFLIMCCSPFLFWRAHTRRVRTRERIAAGTPRILVVPIISRVGDIVCATPVFRQIKHSFPQAHLSVVAAHKVLGIIKNNPRINTLIDFNAPRFHGLRGRGQFFLSLFSGTYDVVFSLGSSPLGTISALAGAAPLRVKTCVPHPFFFERCTDWMNTHCIRYEPGSFLQKHYVSLLSVIGIDASKPVKEIFTTNVGDKKAAEYIIHSYAVFPKLLVGITVSAGNRIKEWPLERFAEVADAIVEKFGARIMFIDSPANQARTLETLRLMRKKEAAAVATHFSLEELPSLVKALSAFIAVDTGTIYIAHALGVPLIDIIGPVHPDEQPPHDEKSIPILPTAGIAPSSFVLTPQTRGADHARAVRSIYPPDVIAAFDMLITRGFISLASPVYVYEKNP